MRKKAYKWTEERINILKEYYPYVTEWDELCKKLENYDIVSLRNKGKKLKLKRPRNWWTKEKEDLLRKYYFDTGWNELLHIFGVKNKQILISKAFLLGIKRENIGEYSEEELDFIKNNYNSIPYIEIANRLGRNLSAIYVKINRMGLEKNDPKWTDTEIDLFSKGYSNYKNEELKTRFFPNRN